MVVGIEYLAWLLVLGPGGRWFVMWVGKRSMEQEEMHYLGME